MPQLDEKKSEPTTRRPTRMCALSALLLKKRRLQNRAI
jgi:hypothetical protein